MKYKNALNLFPPELIETLQQYVQGEYVYIPIKDKTEPATPTEYEIELQNRDRHIYTRHLEGVSNKKLSEMYNLSESSIRRIISNQRKGYAAMKDKIKSILSNWNTAAIEMTQIYDTTWQVGEEAILKVYESIDMLERNIKIISILDDMGIPVGSIIPTKENTAFARDEQHYYILTERLHGKHIISIQDHLDTVSEMGTIIANLHLAFQECEAQDEFWNNSLLGEMNSWVRSTLEDGNWSYVSKEKFDSTVSDLADLYDKLPVQLIHRDVHFGNFLFDQGKFTGYIDFDLSQRNIRIFDLCYFMTGLLSEEEKLEVTSEEWFAILKKIFAGYEQKIKLSHEEKQAVPYVMKSIELLFAAWFSGQKDVKCAENAMKLFDFVDRNAEKILRAIKRPDCAI